MPKFGKVAKGNWKDTVAGVEDVAGSDGNTRKCLVIRSGPADERPFIIGFGRARMIIKHFPDIQGFIEEHGHKKS